MNNLNNTINKEHPRIKNRDIKRQSIRDDLADILDCFRSDWDIFEYLADYYKTLSHQEVAEKLIEVGEWNFVFLHITEFLWLDNNAIIIKLIETDQEIVSSGLDGVWYLMLNQTTANRMVDVWLWWIVPVYSDAFSWVDYNIIADKLIKTGQWSIIASCPKPFELLNDTEIVHKLIESGEWDAVVSNLENYKWLDHWEIVKHLIGRLEWDIVIENLDKFTWLDDDELASLYKIREDLFSDEY